MLVVDTSALLDWHLVGVDEPFTVSILTRAELEFGIGMARDVTEREVRARRLAEWDARVDWLPYDENATRSYGILATACARVGAKAKARALDLHIAAQAHSVGAGVLTFNTGDFAPVRHLVRIVEP